MKIIEIDATRPVWDLEQFKQYVRKSVDKCYDVTPSTLVLRSFYVANVQRPVEITVKMFDWLRSIAEQEIKNHKSYLASK